MVKRTEEEKDRILRAAKTRLSDEGRRSMERFLAARDVPMSTFRYWLKHGTRDRRRGKRANRPKSSES